MFLLQFNFVLFINHSYKSLNKFEEKFLENITQLYILLISKTVFGLI